MEYWKTGMVEYWINILCNPHHHSIIPDIPSFQSLDSLLQFREDFLHLLLNLVIDIIGRSSLPVGLKNLGVDNSYVPKSENQKDSPR